MRHPYSTEAYALSLPHIGEPVAVPEWGGHVLSRATPCGRFRDAVGPYPLAVISEDADLPAGLQRLRAAGFVSVVVVLGPGLGPSCETLSSGFEVARPFKSHYLLDRRLGPLTYAKHHRYELRRALQHVSVSEISLLEHRAAWRALYGELSARHGLRELHAFPASHHEALELLPGVRAFGAFIDERLVSAHLFVTQGHYAVSHLAASSPEGYAARAAYAVNDLALTALDDCDVVNLGGGAGLADDPGDGLARFKKGFANTAAAAYLCGRVLDRQAYDALSVAAHGTFFPAYRGRRAEPSHAHPG